MTGSRRFIPTGVGNACQCFLCGNIIPVHPHGCGERGLADGLPLGNDGSSPRVWGTLHVLFQCRHDRRFIPTGVGNANGLPASLSFWTVHPHGCGERHAAAQRRCGVAGSSPRVWGTPERKYQELQAERFIPTGVGNAPTAMMWFKRLSVHPHGCGERYILMVWD